MLRGHPGRLKGLWWSGLAQDVVVIVTKELTLVEICACLVEIALDQPLRYKWSRFPSSQHPGFQKVLNFSSENFEFHVAPCIKKKDILICFNRPLPHWSFSDAKHGSWLQIFPLCFVILK